MSPHDSPHTLVGRGPHLTLLRRDTEQALRGGVRATLVCGDAGIGKTGLIEAHLAATRVSRTAVSGCFELGAEGLAYAPFTTLLRTLTRDTDNFEPRHRRELARLVPELGERPGNEDEGRARLFEAGPPRRSGPGRGGPALGRRLHPRPARVPAA